MTPRDVVEAWLDARSRATTWLRRARFPDDAVLHAAEPGGDYRGFDEALG